MFWTIFWIIVVVFVLGSITEKMANSYSPIRPAVKPAVPSRKVEGSVVQEHGLE